ncbi:Response regulator receiver domain-containing protein [Flavobacterium swingsii]|jgi:CheY-like chemotaxis protein|uniref:Response regulator receiver domain-containing protein n=1 Tax=Flavobacterium swingsii TaxID=498292 RepID=A0A1I0ZHV7_9FLAO|nr:response regulator [Flavobacterium swingsii]SFB24110.1 Response regulator receiver domain-containing protein [Flavobacterium swingsii]
MNKVNLTYIIDDDKIFVFVLKKILKKNENFDEVLDFKNGEEVLDLLSNKDNTLPNIILLDINMPVIDGWQFLEEIEKLPNKEKLNVFIMSSSIDTNDIEKSKLFSTVKDFISKPINNDKLNKLIESIS